MQENRLNEQQAEVLVKSLLKSTDYNLSFLATREQIVKLNNKIDKVDSILKTLESRI